MDSLSLNRINLLGIPLDILPEDKIEDLVASFEDGKNHQIVLLSLWDLLRAKRNLEYRTMIAGASLVLPISLSLVRGSRFLKKEEPIRYMPFEFVIKLLGALEKKGKSAYLLGSSRTRIQKAETNIKSTFPGLRVVGRYAGHYPKNVERFIIEAIRKATPSLLLIGMGVPGKERWIPRNLPRFDAGIYLWCSDLFEVFAKSRGKPSKKLFRRGLEWIPYTARRPWKIYRLFAFVWYELLLLVARLRGSY